MAAVRGCLVSGGASGLGLATARRLVKNGYRVVIADLPSSEGDKVARDLGENCIFVPTDVSLELDRGACLCIGYTCQLFLSQMREIFVSPWPGFPKT